MNSTLFLILFSALGLIYLALGFLVSKNIKTVTDYFLAGRNLGLFSVSFTLIATQLGGTLLFGSSQWAYEYGIFGILYALGMALGFLLLSTGIAAKLHSSNVMTTAQLFETRYNSSLLKTIASMISILTFCGILVSQVVATRALIIGLGIENELIFGLFWLFVITYTMIGGLKAVVITDIFQVIFIIISIGGIFLYSLMYTPGPLLPIKTLLEHQLQFDTTVLTLTKMIATFLMPALFSLIEQDLAQRFFASRTHRIALFSALISCIFIITFGVIPVYFGMQAKVIHMAASGGASPLVLILDLITHGNIVFMVAVCGIIAAITSTADSLLCAISSLIAQELKLDEKSSRSIIISQAITLIVGIAAFIASYIVSQNILDIAIGSYALSVSCLLVPLLFSLFKEKLNTNAAVMSALSGLAGFILFQLYPVPILKEIAPLALSLIGFWIGRRL